MKFLEIGSKVWLVGIFFFFSCVDYASIQEENSTLAESLYRIPLGDCSSYQDVTESFSSIWNDLISQTAGVSSKGCARSGACHDYTTNAGGFNLGNPPSAVNTYNNIVNKQGASGKTLITPNNLEQSEFLVRLSLLENAMPQGGELWSNADLTRLKRWICQGAPNN